MLIKKSVTFLFIFLYLTFSKVGVIVDATVGQIFQKCPYYFVILKHNWYTFDNTRARTCIRRKSLSSKNTRTAIDS